MERTLVLLKPDAVQRGLMGEIISRLERKGLKFVGMKMIQVSDDLADRHYEAHIGKPFFAGLKRFITSSPLVALVIEGENVVSVVRNIVGATNPVEATPGSIRGDFGLTIGANLIHGSDAVDSAEREIGLFFAPDELVGYERDIDKWIIES